MGCVHEYQLLGGRFASGELCSVAIAPAGYRGHHHRFRTVGAISGGTLPSRAAVRTAAIAFAEGGVVRIHATAGALPGDDCRCPVLVLRESQTVAGERALAADREEAT